VIFRATDQWFMIIDHRGHRERCLAAIDSQVSWDPESSQNRIREAVRLRPDWCLSRQRNWGVGIPAIYCDACREPDLNPDVMRRAAELTRERGSDVWYDRPVEDFLPAGYRCPRCGSDGPFRQETDVLDVWFDSGSTHRAVQVTHPPLAEVWPRARREGGVLYFEGPDQHRGWFNSSLMVGVGVSDEPPYTQVATHGWVLDGEGRAMHKSLGNVISPLTLIAVHGADVLRWWALSTDWRTDVRVSDEIMQRVADAYRKVRNTFRFLLGNLGDFRRDALLPERQLTRVDRAFLGHLRDELESVRRSWEELRFHRALDQLLQLCTVDLSAVILDVAKDRLYTLAPDDPRRRSAQTVLWHALHDLALAVSPALVFTADEVWQHHPDLLAESESVHLALWPPRDVPGGARDEWDFMLKLRDVVYARIEPLRAAKEFATSTEAEVVVTASHAAADHLREYQSTSDDELAGFLMVARVTVKSGDPPPGEDFAVEVTRTSLLKCDRCWTYRADVGEEPGGRLCARCAGVLTATGRRAD
jgi:isoleucyl-tRNA synthetase